MKNVSHKIAVETVVLGQHAGESSAFKGERTRLLFKFSDQVFWLAAIEPLVVLGGRKVEFGDAFPMQCVVLEMHTMDQYTIWNSKIICLLTGLGPCQQTRNTDT